MSEKNDDNNNEFVKYYKEVGPYIGLGLQLAVTVAVMVFIGYWIDGKTGSSPLYTIIFSMLGIVVGLYQFLKTVLQKDKKNK